MVLGVHHSGFGLGCLESHLYWLMLQHYVNQDPAHLHHLLPMVATLFGTLGMYWILGWAWVRDSIRRVFTLAKDWFARLR
jgi:hypothetical protein